MAHSEHAVKTAPEPGCLSLAWRDFDTSGVYGSPLIDRLFGGS